jgi:hypothetical protein
MGQRESLCILGSWRYCVFVLAPKGLAGACHASTLRRHTSSGEAWGLATTRGEGAVIGVSVF